MKTIIACKCGAQLEIHWVVDTEYDTYTVLDHTHIDNCKCDHTNLELYDLLLDWGERQSEIQSEHRWER